MFRWIFPVWPSFAGPHRPLFCTNHGPSQIQSRPHSFQTVSVLFFTGCWQMTPKGALTMEWVTPQHEQIDLNCEVSSYANAEL